MPWLRKSRIGGPRRVRMMGVRRALVVLAVLAMSLATGCEQEAAHQLDLPGTTWEIVSVADKGLAGPLPTIAFSEDGNSASLTLACGEMELGWAWDSDGSAISFGVKGRAPDCANLWGDDGEVLDAVLAAEEWSVQDDRHITIGGEDGVRLKRP